jgi:hypothetical protein
MLDNRKETRGYCKLEEGTLDRSLCRTLFRRGLRSCGKTDCGVMREPLLLYTIKKVKQSHYRPGQAQRVPGGRGSQISRQSAHEGGEVVSPTHRPPLPPRKYSWYSFLLEAESHYDPRAIVWPEGLCQWEFEWPHQESNPRPSGLQHSASTNFSVVHPDQYLTS